MGLFGSTNAEKLQKLQKFAFKRLKGLEVDIDKKKQSMQKKAPNSPELLMLEGQLAKMQAERQDVDRQIKDRAQAIDVQVSKQAAKPKLSLLAKANQFLGRKKPNAQKSNSKPNAQARKKQVTGSANTQGALTQSMVVLQGLDNAAATTQGNAKHASAPAVQESANSPKNAQTNVKTQQATQQSANSPKNAQTNVKTQATQQSANSPKNAQTNVKTQATQQSANSPTNAQTNVNTQQATQQSAHSPTNVQTNVKTQAAQQSANSPKNAQAMAQTNGQAKKQQTKGHSRQQQQASKNAQAKSQAGTNTNAKANRNVNSKVMNNPDLLALIAEGMASHNMNRKMTCTFH